MKKTKLQPSGSLVLIMNKFNQVADCASQVFFPKIERTTHLFSIKIVEETSNLLKNFCGILTIFFLKGLFVIQFLVNLQTINNEPLN